MDPEKLLQTIVEALVADIRKVLPEDSTDEDHEMLNRLEELRKLVATYEEWRAKGGFEPVIEISGDHLKEIIMHAITSRWQQVESVLILKHAIRNARSNYEFPPDEDNKSGDNDAK